MGSRNGHLIVSVGHMNRVRMGFKKIWKFGPIFFRTLKVLGNYDCVTSVLERSWKINF